LDFSGVAQEQLPQLQPITLYRCGLGFVMLIATTLIDYRNWRNLRRIVCAPILVTALVFVPHIGSTRGGRRLDHYLWHFFSTLKALKLACVIISAAY